MEVGPNVARGHVNISCPFCGLSDPSEHMGINLKTRMWGCWRSTSHRGVKPQRLVRALIGCSWQEADEIVGSDIGELNLSPVSELRSRLSGLGDQRPKKRVPVEFLREFRKIRARGTTAKFWHYVANRGFATDDVNDVVSRYSLQCCNAGFWGARLIIPHHDMEGNLLGWIGRTIYPDREPRYRVEPGGSQIKHSLYNLDLVAKEGGRELVLVEGPFDAMKLDFYLHRIGIGAVAMLGLSLWPNQIAALARIVDRFDRVTLMLDQQARSQAIRIASDLKIVDIRIKTLPDEVDDPGALTKDQVLKLF